MTLSQLTVPDLPFLISGILATIGVLLHIFQSSRQQDRVDARFLHDAKEREREPAKPAREHGTASALQGLIDQLAGWDNEDAAGEKRFRTGLLLFSALISLGMVVVVLLHSLRY
jgi:hypothetical protein